MTLLQENNRFQHYLVMQTWDDGTETIYIEATTSRSKARYDCYTVASKSFEGRIVSSQIEMTGIHLSNLEPHTPVHVLTSHGRYQSPIAEQEERRETTK